MSSCEWLKKKSCPTCSHTAICWISWFILNCHKGSSHPAVVPKSLDRHSGWNYNLFCIHPQKASVKPAWSLTWSLWVCLDVDASLLVHLCLSGQQQVARLVLRPVVLSPLVIVHHVQHRVVPVNGFLPVLLSGWEMNNAQTSNSTFLPAIKGLQKSLYRAVISRQDLNFSQLHWPVSW